MILLVAGQSGFRWGKPNGEQPNGEQPNGEQPNGEQLNGEQLNGEQLNGEQLNGERLNRERLNRERTGERSMAIVERCKQQERPSGYSFSKLRRIAERS